MRDENWVNDSDPRNKEATQKIFHYSSLTPCLLPLKDGDLIELLNSKLASFLSATDRLRDAEDVQSLVSNHDLPLEFEAQLAPAVRSAYRRIWCGEM